MWSSLRLLFRPGFFFYPQKFLFSLWDIHLTLFSVTRRSYEIRWPDSFVSTIIFSISQSLYFLNCLVESFMNESESSLTSSSSLIYCSCISVSFYKYSCTWFKGIGGRKYFWYREGYILNSRYISFKSPCLISWVVLWIKRVHYVRYGLISYLSTSLILLVKNWNSPSLRVSILSFLCLSLKCWKLLDLLNFCERFLKYALIFFCLNGLYLLRFLISFLLLFFFLFYDIEIN